LYLVVKLVQSSPSIVIPQLFSDGVDLIAIRQNMLGIKARAEGAGSPALAVTYTELALWVATFLGFLVAEVGLVVRRDWLQPGLSVSATGLITIGLLLVKPPVWVDMCWLQSAPWQDYGGCIGRLSAERYLAQGDRHMGRRDDRRPSHDEKETQ
jgi:hypothetical protein